MQETHDPQVHAAGVVLYFWLGTCCKMVGVASGPGYKCKESRRSLGCHGNVMSDSKVVLESWVLGPT